MMPFYYYILIIVGGLIIYVAIGYLMNIYRDKMVYDEIEVYCLKNNLHYQKSTNKLYDAVIFNDEMEMYLKITKIPSNSSVTINSKDTWCLRFGGGKRKGRNYPEKRYMNELVSFLRHNPISEEKQTIKVFILYPTTEVILKYINESEIVEIKPKDTPYGYKVIKYSDFESHFSDLTNTIKKVENK